MATTYYCDPAATGLNDGTSWTDAWVSIASYWTAAVAGDTCKARGTQTLAATLGAPANSGTTNLPIFVIGCNASGVADGTQFVLDGNNAAVNIFSVAGKTAWYFENVTAKRATGLCVLSGTTSLITFVNSKLILNGGNALSNGAGSTQGYLCIKTQLNNNLAGLGGGAGIQGTNSFIFSELSYNTTFGATSSASYSFYNKSLVIKNGTFGMTHSGTVYRGTIDGCTIHGNGSTGVSEGTGWMMILLSRITGNVTSGITWGALSSGYYDYNFISFIFHILLFR